MSKSIQKAAWIAFVVLAVGVVFYAVQRSGDEPGDGGASAEASSDPQPVEILKYSDYQCPACKMYIPLENELEREFGEMVSFEYRHFPLNGHAYAELASRSVEAATEQGYREEMHDMIFDGQEEWSQGNAGEIFRGYAEEIGLDLNQFEEDLESEEIRQRVQSQKAEGERRQVRATPTYFINGRKIQQNPQSYEQFRAIVEMFMYQ
ncbi:MAG: thioredoxin domain-containing protein [Balneolaceae bacterium]